MRRGLGLRASLRSSAYRVFRQVVVYQQECEEIETWGDISRKGPGLLEKFKVNVVQFSRQTLLVAGLSLATEDE